MRGKLRMKSWEAACIAATALLVACFAAQAAHYQFTMATHENAFAEALAKLFEDPECAAFVQSPATALPDTADMVGDRCFNVVAIRTLARRDGDLRPITAAGIRAWAKTPRVRASELARDAAILAGILLATLYGAGLVTEAAAGRVPIVSAPVRSLVNRVPAGRGRRLALFVVQLVAFLGFLGLLAASIRLLAFVLG